METALEHAFRDNRMDVFAIVRDVPNSFQKCVTTFHNKRKINVALAKQQHQQYCETLSSLGLKLIRIEADDTLPDCCFTEDTVIVFDVFAVITIPGAPSRIPETIEIEKTLSRLKTIVHITKPGTIEGGDVLRIGKKIFIGNSGRTNEEGIRQVASVIKHKGYQVIPVKIRNALHLKSVCTYLGNGCIILAEGYLDEKIFSEYDKIIVPKGEEYCANCLVVNGSVLIPKGFPKTKKIIENNGFPIIEIEMSEIEKAEGALTCLSVIF
ncbi:MAG: arginine deiminase family protein [Bacteroidota bacterium]